MWAGPTNLIPTLYYKFFKQCIEILHAEFLITLKCDNVQEDSAAYHMTYLSCLSMFITETIFYLLIYSCEF
jgi:hypothetical protein